MKKIIIFFIIFALILLFSLQCNTPGSSGGGNDDVSSSDGAITFNLTGAAVPNGTDCYVGIYNDGANTQIDDYVEGLYGSINGGIASSTSITTFPEGNNYDIWIFVDLDDDANPADPQPDGGDMVNPIAYDITISGNKTASFIYGNLVPLPPNGTIEVNLTGATVPDGTDCYIGIYNDGADPENESCVEALEGIINGETASSTSTIFPGGNNYDIWLFVDLNDNANPDNPQPDSGDKYTNIPSDVSINGNQTVDIIYGDLDDM